MVSENRKAHELLCRLQVICGLFSCAVKTVDIAIGRGDVLITYVKMKRVEGEVDVA